MPYLTPEDRKNLLGRKKGFECPTCKVEYDRGYCRQCDEFYFLCGCDRETGHEGHRTY